MFMRASQAGLVVAGGLLTLCSAARAQDITPPAATTAAEPASPPASPPATPPPPPPAPPPPPPPATAPAALPAAPSPPAPSPSADETPAPSSPPVLPANSETYPDRWSDPGYAAPPSSSDWHFSTRGFFRAPLRIGMGSRPPCAPGTTVPYPVVSPLSVGGQSYQNWYCALPNQSRTTFHSPYIPDDQYLGWTFDRTWEKAWSELYVSYGTNRIVGTVGLAAYDFTDTSLLGNAASPAQFGFYQGWVTVTPGLPSRNIRLDWKIGAFDEKYGMASKTSGGAYDTFMF